MPLCHGIGPTVGETLSCVSAACVALIEGCRQSSPLLSECRPTFEMSSSFTTSRSGCRRIAHTACKMQQLRGHSEPAASGKPALGVQGRHTTCPGRGYCLAIITVRDIARGENPFYAGVGSLRFGPAYVARFVLELSPGMRYTLRLSSSERRSCDSTSWPPTGQGFRTALTDMGEAFRWILQASGCCR